MLDHVDHGGSDGAAAPAERAPERIISLEPPTDPSPAVTDRGTDHHVVDPDDVRLLLSTAVHEFRTPLAAISGFATFLRRHWGELDDDDKLRYLDSINRQAVRLSGLTSDLLEVSRLDAGAMHLEPTRINLLRAIELAVESVGPACPIVLECSPEVEVLADAEDVREMLINYIGNAVKYGEAPITVAAAPVDDFVLVRVRDHGPGVPNDFVPHLFERFRRARTESVQKKGGTGLGLAIVRGLAEAQGGRAWFEPTENGASFCLTLPIADGRRVPERPA